MSNKFRHQSSFASRMLIRRVLPQYADALGESDKIAKSLPVWIQRKFEGEPVYGVHPVRLALEAKRRKLYRLFVKRAGQAATVAGKAPYSPNERQIVKDLATRARAQRIPCEMISSTVMDVITLNRPHQGVVLDASRLEYEALPLEQQIPSTSTGCPMRVTVLADQVKDPMNFGAILRSCYIFGVAKIVAERRHSARLSNVVSKASAGLMEVMRVYNVPSAEEYLRLCRERGVPVVGTSHNHDASAEGLQAEELSLSMMKLNQGQVVLVVGNEGGGIRPELAQYVSRWMSIPTARNVPLNVSVATALCLDRLCR